MPSCAMPVTMATSVKSIGNSSTNTCNERHEKSPDTSKWRIFASNTTLHGLRHIVRNESSFFKRFIWFLFLCTAAGTYCYLSTISVTKYFSRPLKTVISQETPNNGLKFPAVTICNLNIFMKSKIDTADEDENFVKLGLNITGCSDNEFRSARGNLTCGQALLCAYEWYGSAIVRGCNKSVRQNIVNALNRSSERIYNEEEFLARYGHNITGMFLLYCRFMKTTECSDEDFIPRLTESGICYTFNSGQKSPALRAIFEGPDFGLNILLDVQTNESTVADFSHGLKVIVHDQDTFVNRHIGFNIPPGFHATVAVKLRKHIRLPKPYKTNCRQANLPGIGTYTKDGCITQCLANATLARCGCRIIGLQDQSDAPLCSMQDANCVYQSEIDVGEVNLSACSCSNACTELEYETRVSYSKFPDNSIIDILHHTFGKKESSSYMRDNYVFLQVGFQHLAYEKREDVPSYKLESLLGEFGGNMGLFLGCSLLTLCEFLDFVWAAVLSRMRRRSVEISSTEY